MIHVAQESYELKCVYGIAARLLTVLGVKFERQFSLASYKEFLTSHNLSQVEYSVVEGRMPCAFAIITNC